MYKTKDYIIKWLDKYGIKKYTINDDLTVDVDGDVLLWNKKIYEIPIQFNIVNGNFNCGSNKISSLRGCPKTVKGNFYCYNNKYLNSLEYLPIVYGKVVCSFDKERTKEYKMWKLMHSLQK